MNICDTCQKHMQKNTSFLHAATWVHGLDDICSTVKQIFALCFCMTSICLVSDCGAHAIRYLVNHNIHFVLSPYVYTFNCK